MADMEDLFGSDADSDPERKGGVRRASVETGVVGLLRREPDSDPIPGLRALWRRWRMALPHRLPQRPLLPWRCQPFPEGGDEGTDAECVPRGSWCPSSKSILGAWGAKGARGRNGGRWAGAARGETLRVLPALSCLAHGLLWMNGSYVFRNMGMGWTNLQRGSDCPFEWNQNVAWWKV